MSNSPSSLPTGPVTALVEYQVRKEVCSTAQWLEVWGARGRDALEGEPETNAYEALVATDDATRVLVFERYANGRASIDAHVQRPAHAELLATMGERNMTKRLVMQTLLTDIPGYGWWQRHEQTSQQTTRDLSVTIFGTRFESQEALEEYMAITGEHAAYCQGAEPGTLIYSAGLAHSDGDRGPDVQAGDLVFVAAFADESAVNQHRDDPRHVAVQKKLESVKRERTFLQTYRTTGEGFLWRAR